MLKTHPRASPSILSSGKPSTPAIQIKRGGKLYPLRQHEILYANDELVFPPEAGSKSSVKVLVDAQRHVTL